MIGVDEEEQSLLLMITERDSYNTGISFENRIERILKRAD